MDERVTSLRPPVGGMTLNLVLAYGQNVGKEYQAFLVSPRGVLGRAPLRDSNILLEDFNAYVGNDSDTWRGLIVKNGPPALNMRSVSLLDSVSHGLSIIDTMFNYKNADWCTWYQDTLSWRSMIDFVVDLPTFGHISWTLEGKEGGSCQQITTLW